VAFDLDGVLFLSTEAHTWAYSHVLASQGVTDFDYANWAGMRTGEAFQRILALHDRPAMTVAVSGGIRVLERLPCTDTTDSCRRVKVTHDKGLAPFVKSIDGFARQYRDLNTDADVARMLADVPTPRDRARGLARR
jgi:phosphoglycolate phosphatase-like HAD superfamily hydrolase